MSFWSFWNGKEVAVTPPPPEPIGVVAVLYLAFGQFAKRFLCLRNARRSFASITKRGFMILLSKKRLNQAFYDCKSCKSVHNET